MRGVTLYEPNELVLSAKSGTPLAQIEELLGRNGQELAFEPCALEQALGSGGEATIGGVIATNVSGPAESLRGAARDHLIGVRAVNGLGEVIKSGGRVMKNVTGYDIARALSGSWGTLGGDERGYRQSVAEGGGRHAPSSASTSPTKLLSAPCAMRWAAPTKSPAPCICSAHSWSGWQFPMSPRSASR